MGGWVCVPLHLAYEPLKVGWSMVSISEVMWIVAGDGRSILVIEIGGAAREDGYKRLLGAVLGAVVACKTVRKIVELGLKG